MSAIAGRTGLFPIGPTDPYAFEAGSHQRTEIAKALREIRDTGWRFASTVDGQELRTGNVHNVVAPHNHSHVLGQVDFGGAEQAQAAVDASVKNARWWGSLPWEERVAPFLRAADMLEYGPWRAKLNAATMLELSKTTYQADIDDAACEAVDFIRANVKNMLDMYDVQPGSNPGGIMGVII